MKIHQHGVDFYGFLLCLAKESSPALKARGVCTLINKLLMRQLPDGIYTCKSGLYRTGVIMVML
jgi:hypothetical protein